MNFREWFRGGGHAFGCSPAEARINSVIYSGEQMAHKPVFGKDVQFIHSDTVGDACKSLDLHANETRTSRRREREKRMHEDPVWTEEDIKRRLQH